VPARVKISVSVTVYSVVYSSSHAGLGLSHKSLKNQPAFGRKKFV